MGPKNKRKEDGSRQPSNGTGKKRNKAAYLVQSAPVPTSSTPLIDSELLPATVEGPSIAVPKRRKSRLREKSCHSQKH